MTDPATYRRTDLPGAVDARLFFAQVREDPALEVEALAAGRDDTVVVVSSGGDTALSLLATGTGRVVAVDLNRAQNSVVELKAAAVATLPAAEATAFLGAAPADDRAATYAGLRDRVGPATRAYWDSRSSAVKAGILNSGVTEKFLRALVTVIRTAIHPPSRIRRLLAAKTLDEQREFYRREWNTRRWRLLFTVLANRAVFRQTYDPVFFAHVENPSFSKHFHGVAEHGLTNVPVGNNYFLHHILTGRFPAGAPGGVPPYLAPDTPLDDLPARLHLVDGSYGDYLKTCADGTIRGFALSNICEWLDEKGVDELFAEIVRTATPGARLVFRNFVGWTEVPERWRSAVVEDRSRGEALIAGDRSLMQRRIAVCTVNP